MLTTDELYGRPSFFSAETLKDRYTLPEIRPLQPSQASSFRSRERQALLNELTTIQAELFHLDTPDSRVLEISDRLAKMKVYFERELS